MIAAFWLVFRFKYGVRWWIVIGKNSSRLENLCACEENFLSPLEYILKINARELAVLLSQSACFPVSLEPTPVRLVSPPHCWNASYWGLHCAPCGEMSQSVSSHFPWPLQSIPHQFTASLKHFPHQAPGPPPFLLFHVSCSDPLQFQYWISLSSHDFCPECPRACSHSSAPFLLSPSDDLMHFCTFRYPLSSSSADYSPEFQTETQLSTHLHLEVW